MNYPFKNKQTLFQWILNTVDPRIWGVDREHCKCCWHIVHGKLKWMVLAGCPKHDKTTLGVIYDRWRKNKIKKRY